MSFVVTHNRRAWYAQWFGNICSALETAKFSRGASTISVVGIQDDHTGIADGFIVNPNGFVTFTDDVQEALATGSLRVPWKDIKIALINESRLSHFLEVEAQGNNHVIIASCPCQHWESVDRVLRAKKGNVYVMSSAKNRGTITAAQGLNTALTPLSDARMTHSVRRKKWYSPWFSAVCNALEQANGQWGDTYVTVLGIQADTGGNYSTRKENVAMQDDFQEALKQKRLNVEWKNVKCMLIHASHLAAVLEAESRDKSYVIIASCPSQHFDFVKSASRGNKNVFNEFGREDGVCCMDHESDPLANVRRSAAVPMLFELKQVPTWGTQDADDWFTRCMLHEHNARKLERCMRKQQGIRTADAGKILKQLKQIHTESWLAAQRAYHKATNLDPRHIQAWNNIGNILKEQGDVNGANGAYEQCIRIDPDCSEAWFNIGHLHHVLTRDFAAAKRAYCTVVRLAPRDIDAWLNLSKLFKQMNDRSGYIAAYTKAIDLDHRSVLARIICPKSYKLNHSHTSRS